MHTGGAWRIPTSASDLLTHTTPHLVLLHRRWGHCFEHTSSPCFASFFVLFTGWPFQSPAHFSLEVFVCFLNSSYLWLSSMCPLTPSSQRTVIFVIPTCFSKPQNNTLSLLIRWLLLLLSSRHTALYICCYCVNSLWRCFTSQCSFQFEHNWDRFLPYLVKSKWLLLFPLFRNEFLGEFYTAEFYINNKCLLLWFEVSSNVS